MTKGEWAEEEQTTDTEGAKGAGWLPIKKEWRSNRIARLGAS